MDRGQSLGPILTWRARRGRAVEEEELVSYRIQLPYRLPNPTGFPRTHVHEGSVRLSMDVYTYVRMCIHLGMIIEKRSMNFRVEHSNSWTGRKIGVAWVPHAGVRFPSKINVGCDGVAQQLSAPSEDAGSVPSIRVGVHDQHKWAIKKLGHLRKKNKIITFLKRRECWAF